MQSMQSTETQEQRYMYAAPPHAAPGLRKKTKFRPEEEEESPPQNMYVFHYQNNSLV